MAVAHSFLLPAITLTGRESVDEHATSTLRYQSVYALDLTHSCQHTTSCNHIQRRSGESIAEATIARADTLNVVSDSPGEPTMIQPL